METDNLQVIPSYFHADKLGEWKEAAFVFLGAAIVGGAIAAGVAAAGAGDENGDGSTSLAEARF